ncbi:helix-turn-helix domain-containing protein [Streptomyces sp. NPDC058155]|uniref:helix-turn-helix domain-containing protein n=1 Tax=Streptomyces sp. NPDC058155 TaxID=3346359 RepID=UPI0036E27B7F
MWQLSVEALKEAAKRAHGDITGYAISRRTGISESSAYRILSGAAQPDLNTALRLATAYAVPVEQLVERIETDDSIAA